MKRPILAAAFVFSLIAAPALAQQTTAVERDAVEAHMTFLAGDELRGRGSATADEAIAAAYVAAQFRLAGLTPAPGMDGYLQRAPVVKTTPSGQATLTIGDVTIDRAGGLAVLSGADLSASGAAVVMEGDDPSAMPAGEVVLIAPPEGPGARAWIGAAIGKGAKLIVLRQTDALAQMAAGRDAGGPSIRLADAPARSNPAIVVVPAEAFDRMRAAGGSATFDTGQPTVEQGVTTNAIGWMQGTDPAAGVLMISAHLDHLGVVDGVIMHGANDDASGTVAVIELARALASGEPHRRSLMFVAYGAEEAGLLGSRYFVDHPPIPLTDIVANLEIEMIGKQDPTLGNGVMMMTGFERSNFGPTLKAGGALIGPDPYPEQNFFQRSDNYALAQRGIVAHTISGWATIPTYHTAEDTIANLDMDFMVAAIQSLVEPLRTMADGDFKPEWAEGRRPEPR